MDPALILGIVNFVLLVASIVVKKTKTPVDDKVLDVVKEHAPAVIEAVLKSQKKA